MEEINEVKNWILQEVFPDIVKSGKLRENLKNSEKLNKNANESFKVVDVSIHPIGTDEAFMLTKCYRIKIEYTSRLYEHEKHSTLILIAKKTPEIAPENYEAVSFSTLFHNEITAYTVIIPELLQFSKVDAKDRNFPKYFYSTLQDYAASIVLGDFNPDGWHMTKSRVNLSFEHILLGAQHIGIFHGLGYALKSVDKNKFDSIIGLLKESRYARPPPTHWALMCGTSVTRFTKSVDKYYPEIPSEFVGKLQELLANNYDYSKKRVQPIEPYATLCHGDYLRNNIAFAYDNKEDPTLPTNVMMFDFQTLRYSSPMVDLCVFLSLSAGKDVRTVHFNEIFNAYHQKLSSAFVNHTTGEFPEFLSKSKLLTEYVKYLPYSLGIASYFLGPLHVPDEMTQEDMLGDDFDIDVLLEDAVKRGGDVVDVEIASLVNELYELTVQENVDIFEGFV